MTRATGTSMKTTKPIKAQLGSGKTGMTGASGCLSNACSGLACKRQRQVSQSKAHPNKLEGNQAWWQAGNKTEGKSLSHAWDRDEDDDLGLGLNSQPSNMPGSGLPAEGIAPEQIEQMLGMLGDLFGSRNSRYDNRGYRSQIRRQLRFKLKQWNIPQPSWLDDYGAKMNVNEFRNRAFAWMKAIKEGSRVPPPVPEQGLPEAGRSNEVKQLYRQMSDLQENLQHWMDTLPPEGLPEDEPSSPSSEMDFTDPRKTKSEPALSPRPNANTGLPGEGISVGSAMHVSCVNGSVVVQPVTPAEVTPAPAPPCPDVCMQPEPMSAQDLPVEGSAGSSWVEVEPAEETATEASFNILDGIETVASEVLEEEEKFWCWTQLAWRRHQKIFRHSIFSSLNSYAWPSLPVEGTKTKDLTIINLELEKGINSK